MPQRQSTRRAGLLAGMRIRKKLIFLHTVFSLSLALVLLVALWPPSREVIRDAEIDEARLVLRQLAGLAEGSRERAAELARSFSSDQVSVSEVTTPIAMAQSEIDAARASPGDPVPSGSRGAAVWVGGEGEGAVFRAEATIPEARRAVVRLYVFVVLALLGVYGIVAAALEVLVLPQHVYGPIRRMIQAEQAVQAGRAEHELIPESEIPADELGEIMRSRNASIVALRQHEGALAEALGRLEEVANDLRRKNHLLENARQNLADAGRLASLGMMSAGIAHELNTPLAVVKGLVERIAARPGRNADAGEITLLLRVVGRLERLSEGLLDVARARPPECQTVELSPLVAEALTLVELDRADRRVSLTHDVPDGFPVHVDGDRLVQVLVNLIRNAVDALSESGRGEPRPASGAVHVEAERSTRDGSEWVSIRVTDDGPGIDPEVLSSLFEPFVSTRLDSRGTGLGLAVAEGIVREHGGVLLARNRRGRAGAEFEIMLPVPPEAEPAAAGQGRDAAIG